MMDPDHSYATVVAMCTLFPGMDKTMFPGVLLSEHPADWTCHIFTASEKCLEYCMVMHAIP